MKKTALTRKKRINPVSKKQAVKNRKLRSLNQYFCERAGGVWTGGNWYNGCVGHQCEICGSYATAINLVEKAHIDKREGKGSNTKENIIIACRECHDHDKWPDGGLVCGKERAREIVREQNDKMGEREC